MKDKSAIRKDIFAYRQGLKEDFVMENSKKIFENIIKSDYYKEACGIFLYASYNNEVDTKFMIEYALKDDKIVCVPKVSVEDENLCKMNFYKISSFSDFIKGYKGIPEPRKGLLNFDFFSENSIIVIPMVAFDEKRSRVGYGKGFYDRYLDTHMFRKTIGVAFEGQKVPFVSENPFDIRPDIIYTEKNIY